MAINLDDRYPGRANPKTLNYPQGSFKNRTSPTSKDGTYLEQDWANDMLGFFQAMMKKAGLTANGDVDTAQASQYLDALIQTMRSTHATETEYGSGKLATTTQAQALVADDVVITPKKLGDAMNAHVLGMGQAWQNVTGSRSFGATYTNTTGRPIALMITQAISNTITGSKVGLAIAVAGRATTNQAICYNGSSDSNAISVTLFDIILPGQEYIITDTGTVSGRVTTFSEMR